MTALPRGGKSGRSVAPRKTIYRDKKIPPMWQEFLDNLKAFRESKGLSQRDAATAMGVSVTVVSLWEKGKSTPHPYDLMVYLEVIGAKQLTVE